MPNSITLAQRYLPILDEVYKAASKTNILDAANQNVRFVGANTVQLFKTSMDGMGNYSRNSGFVSGSVTGTWESHQLARDRARSFVIDRMDNEETMGMAFGTLVGEFIRTKVVPEVDAYSLAKICGTSGINAATPADISSSTNMANELDLAIYTLSENEVPEEGRICFVSEKAYQLLKEDITRYTMNGENGINYNVEMYNGVRIIRVPQSRAYTAITLYDGTTSGQEAGGYVGTASTGYKINFLMLHPSAVIKVMKHVMPRIFSPDEYQAADGWKFDYRCYYDLFVEANKVEGIYLHRGSTALT